MNELKYEPLETRHANELLRVWADEAVIRYTNIEMPCSLCEIDREQSLFGLFYQFCRSSWGQGYATQATEWLLNFMREKYDEVTFLADVVVNNIASEKILRHIGFEFVTEDDGFERNGVVMKIHHYRLRVQ